MSIEDKLAIQEMMGKYSYAWDGKDAETFSELFLPDGIFEVVVPGESSPTVRLTSQGAIRDWATQRHRDNALVQSRHFQSGVVFDDMTADTARTRTMVLVTRQSAGASAPEMRPRPPARPTPGCDRPSKPGAAFRRRARTSSGCGAPEGATGEPLTPYRPAA